jgi:hypothetical protein
MSKNNKIVITDEAFIMFPKKPLLKSNLIEYRCPKCGKRYMSNEHHDCKY